MKPKPPVVKFGTGAVAGGLQVPGADTIIACAAITVSIEYPEAKR